MDRTGGPTIAEETLQAELLDLQLRSLADSSRRRYASTWRQWCEFNTHLGHSVWLPEHDKRTQSTRLALFATHVWSHNAAGHRLQHDTVRSKLSHVAWHHRVFRGFRPSINESHALALTGMAKSTTRRQPRQPVTIAMLHAMFGRLNTARAQDRVIFGGLRSWASSFS